MLQLTARYENRVDLRAGLRGLDKDAFSRAIDTPLGEEVLKIMGREDFIASKVFAGGPQDIRDARFAIDVAGKSLDIDLLRRLTRKYGRDALQNLEKLLAPTQ